MRLGILQRSASLSAASVSWMPGGSLCIEPTSICACARWTISRPIALADAKSGSVFHPVIQSQRCGAEVFRSVPAMHQYANDRLSIRVPLPDARAVIDQNVKGQTSALSLMTSLFDSSFFGLEPSKTYLAVSRSIAPLVRPPAVRAKKPQLRNAPASPKQAPTPSTAAAWLKPPNVLFPVCFLQITASAPSPGVAILILGYIFISHHTCTEDILNMPDKF